jgi:hypothetical protein
MGVKTSANSLSVVHQGSSGMATASAPDVCNTPTPTGPVPMPYPNIAMSSNLLMGTILVSTEGMPIATKDSFFFPSSGDEPGVGGGVASAVFIGKAKFANYSMNVFAEGKNVARLSDPMTNNGNAPNTLTAAEIQANLLSVVPDQVLDMLCKAFCWCNKQGAGGKFGEGSDAGEKIIRRVRPGSLA